MDQFICSNQAIAFKKIMTILALLLISCTSIHAQHMNDLGYPHLKKAIFEPQKQHVHGSSIVSLPNGDLLSCWFQGSGERQANDVRIMGARLKKGDTEWSEPFEMADTPGLPDCNPVLFLNKEGKLFLVWIAVLANRWEQSLLKVRTSDHYNESGAPQWNWQDNILLNPDETFATAVEKGLKHIEPSAAGWSEFAPSYDKMIVEAAKEPQKRSIGWMTRIKPLVHENGTIMLPLYSDGYNFSIMALSQDQGKSWKASAPLVSRGGIQPAIAKRKNGEIVALMRDNGDEPGAIKMSVSVDTGNHWSPVMKTSIPNPGSSVEMLSARDGRWWLVCNDLPSGRNQLSLYTSDDEGSHWINSGILANDTLAKESYSYPAMIQDSNGYIHITYSKQSKTTGNTIEYVRLRPESLNTNR
jgi:predicted neuraminidase